MNDNLSIIPSGPSDPNLQAMPVVDQPPPKPPFNYRKFLTALRKYWWVPLLTLSISGGAGYIYVRQKPPTFLSRASLWETAKVRLPEGSLFTEDSQNAFGTQADLLKSSKLFQLALARLQAGSTNAIPLDKDGKMVPIRLNVGQSGKSSIFYVETTSSDATFARAFLNALIEEYLTYKKNIRQTVSGDTLASISEQLLRLERELKSSQESYASFQKTNNLTLLREEGTAMGGYLTRLRLQLSDLNLESDLLVATTVDQAATGVTNIAGMSATGATSDPQNAIRELEMLKVQRDKLSKKLRPKHPRMVKLDADIERGEKLVGIFRGQSQEQLASSRNSLKLKMDGIQAAIKEWEPKVIDANARLAEADRLRQNITRAQALYDQLASMSQKVDISRNIDQDTLSVLEPASVAERSYKDEQTTLVQAGVGGLGLGLALIFLVAKRDDRMTSLKEIYDVVGEHVVGQVPELEMPRDKSPLPLLAPDDPRHIYAESYRNLRSAILFQQFDGPRPNVILVTSAVPNEGKSTIAANLARTMALSGAKVLLVDGDLRKGHLHQTVGMNREPGFVDLLHSPNDLEKFLQFDSIPNFAFLGSGSHCSNPGDLFLGPNLKVVLNLFREKFDHVIIDSCPVFAADDVTSLAPLVDGTLFVVRSRYSQSRIVRDAIDLLYQRQVKILGLIFNAADTKARNYYYYKYRDYYAENAKSS